MVCAVDIRLGKGNYIPVREKHEAGEVFMDQQKRFINGLIAGLVAGTVMDAIENVAYLLYRQPKVRAVDWVYVILTRRSTSPPGVLPGLFGTSDVWPLPWCCFSQ